MKRKYTKKNSEYWNNLKYKNQDFGELAAASIELSDKASNGTLRSTGKVAQSDRFPNLDLGILPYEYVQGSISISEPILLCQKAWANVSIVRNAVETQVEFSNSKLHVKCKNKTVEKFIKAWLKRINVENLAEQFFRERHRSGNIFIYRIDGAFNSEAKKSLDQLIDNAGENIPFKYFIINPARVANYGGDWYQIFNKSDLGKYSFPKDQWEKLLSENINNQALNGKTMIKLDPSKIYAFFYQKQDYETFAVPPLWSILDDIELKLEFKKIDREIARTVENAILAVTHGTDPDKGGINPSNHQALKDIFSNPSVQRVLVADYTTKVDFVIPDLKKVIGKEKYEVVNEDIREGLQFIMVGEDKFSNMVLKAKMFLAKLEKGQNQFIGFLSKEIERICKEFGFRHIPTLQFEKINLKDEVQLQRVITRLYELGVLTVEETLEAIKSGILPNFDESIVSQKELQKLRDEGLYKPAQMAFDSELSNEEGRPSGTTQEQSGPRETRVVGYTTGKVTGALSKIQEFEREVVGVLEEKYGQPLNEIQMGVASSLTQSIIESCYANEWSDSLSDFIERGEIGGVLPEIAKIASDNDLGYKEASILFHSNSI